MVQSLQEHFKAVSARVRSLGSKYSKRYRPQWQLPLRSLPVESVFVSGSDAEPGLCNGALGTVGLELGGRGGEFMVRKMMDKTMMEER